MCEPLSSYRMAGGAAGRSADPLRRVVDPWLLAGGASIVVNLRKPGRDCGSAVSLAVVPVETFLAILAVIPVLMGDRGRLNSCANGGANRASLGGPLGEETVR